MARLLRRDCPMCGRTFHRRRCEVWRQDRLGRPSLCDRKCLEAWRALSTAEQKKRLARLADQNALLYGTNDPAMRTGPDRVAGSLD